MAIAGIPSPNPDHARTAAELALDMIEAAGQLHLRFPVAVFNSNRAALRSRHGGRHRHPKVHV